jgi:CDP-4-dehydro-6-deoxyglucose reductase
MSHQITIRPSGHVYGVRPGETVLEAALREGFPLPYGCRNGACGTCKGRLLAGRVDYGSHQESALSEEEKRAGYALFCCARPESDLVIECREINAVKDIPVRTMPCRVQEMIRAAPDVMIVRLKLPANERLQFLAGQYIDILLKDGKRRSFSLANPPHDDALLELHIRNYAGGSFTKHVFAGMKEKDILRFEGPLGTFFLREDSDKPVIFLASGTGFAPVKGIIEYALHQGVQRPMHLYWGCRRKDDLYLLELPDQWIREYPGFRFTPVLSEPSPEDNWGGRTGLVHRAVMEDYADLSGHQVYASGTPLMVEAAHREFTRERGLPEDEFYSDAFTPAVAP